MTRCLQAISIRVPPLDSSYHTCQAQGTLERMAYLNCTWQQIHFFHMATDPHASTPSLLWLCAICALTTPAFPGGEYPSVLAASGRLPGCLSSTSMLPLLIPAAALLLASAMSLPLELRPEDVQLHTSCVTRPAPYTKSQQGQDETQRPKELLCSSWPLLLKSVDGPEVGRLLRDFAANHYPR
eukprot:339338-Amphidinium_carterae.1